MTKQIRKPSELPTWFKVENYEKFGSLTLEEYLEQIIIRVNYFKAITEDGEIFEPLLTIPLWDSIKSGDPIVNFELDNGFQTREEIIYNYKAIDTVDYFTASCCCASADEQLESSNKSYANNTYTEAIESSFQDVIGCKTKWISIDLSSATDEELINEIRSKLPLYREELNAEEQELNKVEKQLSTLYDYRCHMLLDLKIWEIEETTKLKRRVIITKPTLLNALFPVSVKNFESAKQLENKTIKAVNDILNTQYSLLRKILLTLQSKPHLAKIQVSTYSC